MSKPIWHPARLDQFIGQTGLLTLLRDELDAAAIDNRPLCHQIWSGPPGLGKTTLAQLLADARRVPFYPIDGAAVNELNLTEIFTQLPADGYDARGRLVDPTKTRPAVIFIDEMENVPSSTIFDKLNKVAEPGPDGRRLFFARVKGDSKQYEIWVPACTFIGATNEIGTLHHKASAFLNRCPIQWVFELYGPEELESILEEVAHDREVQLEDKACQLLAARSQGTPRNALALFERAYIRLQALRHRNPNQLPILSEDIIKEALQLLKIDDAGLTQQQNKYLQALGAATGGKLSLSSLASLLYSDEETLTRTLEPTLMRLGFVQIAPGGRQITAKGLEHLGLATPVSPVLSRLA